MTLKTFGISAAIAASAVVGVVAVNSPAQALVIGGKADYAPLTSLPTTLTVSDEFNNGDLSGGFTNVSGIVVNSVTLSAGSSSGAPYNANYDNTSAFLSNFQYDGVDAVLDLIAGDRVTHTISMESATSLTSTVDFLFNGVIRAVSGGTVLGTANGGFSANKTVLNGVVTSSNFSLDLKAAPIPAPALLPGLVAMGVTALRKRKSEAETVEV